MPMIPPLVRDPPPDERQSSTARPVSVRMVRPQRRYASNFNISFVYEPPPPIPRPGFPTSESTFDKWRAAAELAPHGEGADGLGEAGLAGAAAPPRRTLHDVLLGTTAVVLLGLLGGISYAVWSGAVPGTVALGGTAPNSAGVAAFTQPLADSVSTTAARAVPNLTPSFPSGKDAAANIPVPQPEFEPKAPLPALPPVPDHLALAMPSAVKPAFTVPPPPASGSSTMAADAVSVTVQEAAGPVPWAEPSKPDAAAPAPAVPVVTAVGRPAPEPGAPVPPAKSPEPSSVAPVPAAAAKPVPSTQPSASDATPAVPAIAAVTVRLPPASGWTEAATSALARPPEVAAPPAPPAALSGSLPSAEPTAVPVAMAKVVPPAIRQQMPPPTRDESLRSRMEVAALARAARVKAWRLRLAEARSAAAAGSNAGGPQAGLPTAAVASDDGSQRAAAAVPQQVLRGLHVQKGSPDAAVLSAGPEQADQHLVMVGDQLPGVGRVLAILPRGGSWIVRTERGVIR